MDKFIFLDIDGVMIPEIAKKRHRCFDPRCMHFLGMILQKTNAKIIISSSWRCDTLLDTVELLEEYDFEYCSEIIGVTIRAHRYITDKIHLAIPRGVEIAQWIDTHVHSNNGKNYRKRKINQDYTYVIIDDSTKMLLEQQDHFVHINKIYGLTHNDVIKAVSILNQVG